MNGLCRYNFLFHTWTLRYFNDISNTLGGYELMFHLFQVFLYASIMSVKILLLFAFVLLVQSWVIKAVDI